MIYDALPVLMGVGFLLILEPFETDNATVPNPIFHLTYVFLDDLPSGL